MSATNTASELNVSLEPHLAETLNKLVALLPETMSSELKLVLSGVHPTSSTRLPEKESSNAPISSGDVQQVISYTLLSSISAWTRSTEGQALLQDYKLSPSTYSMVALLAGTRTSPERKFPPTSPIIGPENTSVSRELNDRRAVTAVLNALLSILGSGAATWWAADKLRWKDEWVSRQCSDISPRLLICKTDSFTTHSLRKSYWLYLLQLLWPLQKQYSSSSGMLVVRIPWLKAVNDRYANYARLHQPLIPTLSLTAIATS